MPEPVVVLEHARGTPGSWRTWLAFAAFSVVCILLGSNRMGFLLVHGTIGLLSVAIMFTLFIVAWLSRDISDNGYLTFLGAALFPVAGLVVLHALSYRGMGVFPGIASDASIRLWLASRYMLSASLLTAPFFVRRRVHMTAVLAVSGAVAGLLAATVIVWPVFPTAFVEGTGLTRFAVVSEYAIAVVLLCSIVPLRRLRKEIEPDALRLLIWATVASAGADLLLTLQTDPFAITNVAGNLFAFGGFAMMLAAITRTVILRPMDIVFGELRTSEEHLWRANRLLALLSASREAVARAKDQNDLLMDVCRIIVEVGGYRMAWVGIAVDNEPRTVAPVAAWGNSDGFLNDIEVRWDESPRGEGPSGVSIRTGEPFVSRDIENDPSCAPWAAEAQALGYRSAASLPIVSDGRAFAALCIHSSAVNAFGDEELAILGDVVGAVQTGLDRLRARQQRNEALRALIEHRASLQQTVETRTRELETTVEALERAGDAKDEFLRNMSHELRTPLNSIIGFSSILLRGLPGDLNDEQRAQLMMVNRSGRHLLALISEILDLSRIDAGAVDVEYGDVELSDLVESAAGPIRVLTAEAGLRFTVHLPDTRVVLRTDEGKVRQILVNLLGNAVKFTESGNVELDAEVRPPGWVRLTVRDTGMGIPADEIPLVTDEFHQVARANGLNPEGTGLGLSISKRLATMLGGDLTVESTLGVGSAFTLTLPVDPRVTADCV